MMPTFPTKLHGLYNITKGLMLFIILSCSQLFMAHAHCTHVPLPIQDKEKISYKFIEYMTVKYLGLLTIFLDTTAVNSNSNTYCVQK